MRRKKACVSAKSLWPVEIIIAIDLLTGVRGSFQESKRVRHSLVLESLAFLLTRGEKPNLISKLFFTKKPSESIIKRPCQKLGK